MKYVLDTDTLIYFLKGNESIYERIASFSHGDITTTIINHSELFFGAFNSAYKKKNLQKVSDFFDNIIVLPYCMESSLIFSEQKSLLKKQGKILADLDLMIASIVIKNEGVLVTNNTRHFERIKKLRIDNWVYTPRT
ncbi:MAG: PIN domain-containing protein [Gammaproteobacteria bacterium]|nr:PIN domain-containing protein [Gammaproteobacteria bacterium]